MSQQVKPATVYILYGADDQVLYVGMTTAGMTRLLNHARMKEWWREVRRSEFRHFSTQYTAHRAEVMLIHEHRPVYNIMDNRQTTCKTCDWAEVYKSGECSACFWYRRRHGGRARPDELIVKHARRVEMRERMSYPREGKFLGASHG